MTVEINTHGMVIDFGRHRGMLWTRVPVSYLRWLVNSAPEKADIARAELEHRGTTTPTMEITGHAIDRASQQLLTMWQDDCGHRGPTIGLHAWLLIQAGFAREEGKQDDQGRHHYRGVVWVFQEDTEEWPVLKTVMRE